MNAKLILLFLVVLLAVIPENISIEVEAQQKCLHLNATFKQITIKYKF